MSHNVCAKLWLFVFRIQFCQKNSNADLAGNDPSAALHLNLRKLIDVLDVEVATSPLHNFEF